MFWQPTRIIMSYKLNVNVWGAGVAEVPRWHPGLQPSLMTCTWLPHTPENKPRPSWELRRCTMMQDRTIWRVMILANGLLLRGLGWWGVVEGLYKGLRLGAERYTQGMHTQETIPKEINFWREIPACMLKGSWINCFEKNAVSSLFSAGQRQKRQ